MDQHLVSLGETGVRAGDHRTGDVDSADQREIADEPTGAGGGERVLVIDAGIRRPDHHFAGAQLVERGLHDAALDLAVVFENPERVELAH